MGAAEVIPGVSGSTGAFLTGIYEDLIHSIRSIDRHSLKLLAKFIFFQPDIDSISPGYARRH
jgi:putative membrane protein